MSRILQYACACALVVVGRAFADEGPSSPSSKGAIAAAECFKAASSLEQGGFYRSAAARWARLIAEYPHYERNDEAYYHLGVCWLKEQRYDSAVDSLTTCISLCRKTDVRARARRLLGAIQFAKAEAGAGAYEDAAKTFSELAADVDDDVECADAMYSQAVCLYRCKKYQESNGLITQILDMTVAETRIPDVMMLQGRVLVLLHQQDAALESFTEVIRRWPGHGRIADCEFQRAECLFGMQRFTEASEGFRKASEERGFSHADLALLKYGQAQEKRGEMWDAFEIYASMPRRFPKSRHRDDALAACAKLIARHAAVRSQARRSVVNGNVDGEIAGAFLAAHYYTKSDYAEALRIADLAIALDRANDARQANRLHFLHADILRKMPGLRRRCCRGIQGLGRGDSRRPGVTVESFISCCGHGRGSGHARRCGCYLRRVAA